MRRSQVALIGPYPPPTGGISVHVQRLASLLLTRFDVRVVDPYRGTAEGLGSYVVASGPPGLLAVIRTALIVRAAAVDLVHIHVSSMNRFAYGGHVLVRLLPASARTVLTIHSGRFVPDYRAANGMTRVAIASLVRKFDLVIAVSAEIEAQLRMCGVSGDAISVLPAFIPPDIPGNVDAPGCLRSLLAVGRKLIVTSGYGIGDYGFDVLLDALSRADDLRTSCSVLICLYNTYDDGYVRQLEQLVSQIENAAICRDLTAAEFSLVVSSSDIYVRATMRDGDAVAIREAAHYGKPVVASDCVVRPDGCQLFRTGDPEALAEALRMVLRDPGAGIPSTGGNVNERYIDLYQRCMPKDEC